MANKKKPGGGRGRPSHGGNAKRNRNRQTQSRAVRAEHTQEHDDETAPAAPKAAAKPASKPRGQTKAPVHKSDRGPTRQERIEAKRRSKKRRERTYRLGIPAAIILVIVAIVVLSNRGEPVTQPAAVGEIHVDSPARTSLLAVGDQVPVFTAPQLNGGTLDLTQYNADPYALAIFSPNCDTCEKVIPRLDRASNEYASTVGLAAVATAIDDGDLTIDDFMDSRSLSFAVAIDDAPQTLAKALGAGPDEASKYPVIYFVGKDNTIVNVQTGDVSEEAIREQLKELNKLVPQPSPSPSPGDEKQGDGQGQGGGQGQGDGGQATAAPDATTAIQPPVAPATSAP